MPVKTPKFWYEYQSLGSRLLGAALAPLAALYGLARRVKSGSVTRYDPGIPVLCIGNLVAGGSGKTPTALALCDLVRSEGIAQHPVFLTRGYGGKLRGPVQVDPAIHSAADVGDEALLLARRAPTLLCRDRAEGARIALALGPDLLIMDDGFQNETLKKTLSLVVVDGETGFGNGRLLPAGPLREPVHSGFRRADAFFILGQDRQGIGALMAADKPVFFASLQAYATGLPDRARRYVAFAGLGRPEKFRKTLEDLGFTLSGWHPFPDHHPYSLQEINRLEREARAHDAALMTTAKDAVRIPPGILSVPLAILPVGIEVAQRDSLVSFLKRALKAP